MKQRSWLQTPQSGELGLGAGQRDLRPGSCPLTLKEPGHPHRSQGVPGYRLADSHPALRSLPRNPAPNHPGRKPRRKEGASLGAQATQEGMGHEDKEVSCPVALQRGRGRPVSQSGWEGEVEWLGRDPTPLPDRLGNKETEAHRTAGLLTRWAEARPPCPRPSPSGSVPQLSWEEGPVTPAMAMTNHTPPSDSLGWGWPLGLGLAFLGCLLESRELPGTWSASKVARALGQEAATWTQGTSGKESQAAQIRHLKWAGPVSGLSVRPHLSCRGHHQHLQVTPTATPPHGRWVPE